ncbi:hypothetical protein [Hydrogenophaga sp. 5NK40-0174]|uniref:hypothetical protein n=1 Tax=Hydrogenophaga sp. 5NK40-0174 TaxID=3127649 RepID=UPI00310B108B
MNEAEAGHRLSTRDQRTYYVSDERLAAFGQLSYLQRLQWVEQCSQFVRMAQAAKKDVVDASLKL